MGGAELRTQHSLPEWATTFLRDRSYALSAGLLGGDAVISVDAEEDSIHCWGLLLLAAVDAGPGIRSALEDLHLLHARIVERAERGGCADIAPDVDDLARRILADRLRHLTDVALARIQG